MTTPILAPDGAERYLGRLRQALAGFPAETRDEILSDLRSLIAEQTDAAGIGGVFGSFAHLLRKAHPCSEKCSPA